MTIPSDALQPWEQLDARGFVVRGQRGASRINAATVFLPGCERDADSIDGVSRIGEALHLDGGAVGDRLLAYARYRLVLEGQQPGAVCVDVDPLLLPGGKQSEYYVGIAAYSRGQWEWSGPFTTNNVRLDTGEAVRGGADYLSPLGNLMLIIVAFNGAKLDVVGVGANPLIPADTAPPPPPATLTATALQHAVGLSWPAVAQADLAGYRVYYSEQPFTSTSAPGVNHPVYLVARPEFVIGGVADRQYVRVSAVDTSGNESMLGPAANVEPLPGTALKAGLSASLPSVLWNEPITLTAAGGELYDWDLDGDGAYEVTGDTTGQAQADTSVLEVSRPAVRARSADGTQLALAGVSFLAYANSRPVASATAAPQTGKAPLTVTFSGEASDVEDPPAALTIAWDLNGDGIFDDGDGTLNPPPVTYDTPGIYNAKLRVTDTLDAWDVDTVAVQVLEPDNIPPVAELAVKPAYGFPGSAISLDAAGSSDSDGQIAKYEWDFNGDGLIEAYGLNPVILHIYETTGFWKPKVFVTDNDGAVASASATVYINEDLSGPGAWPSFGHDARQTRRSQYVGTSSDELKWSFRTLGPGTNLGSPRIAPDGNIYVAPARTGELSDHRLYSFLPNGILRWEFDSGGKINGEPQFAPDGSIVISSQPNRIIVLNPNGTEKWRTSLGGTITSNPTVGPDGTIYAGCYSNQTLYSLTSGGLPLWAWVGTFAIYNPPAVAPDGTVYVATIDYFLHALTPGGSLKWSLEFPTRIDGLLPRADSGIYVTDAHGHFYAISPDSSLDWQHDFTDGLLSAPAYAADGSILVGQAGITALSPAGGVNWSFAAGGATLSRPAVDGGGRIYFGCDDNKLYVLDPAGTLDWTFDAGHPVRTTPAIDGDGNILFCTYQDALVCIDDSPAELWDFTTGNYVYSSPVIGADGTVYFGSNDHFLYAVDAVGYYKWAYDTGAEVQDSPALAADGTIYVCNIQPELLALDGTGSLLWTLPGRSGPVLVGPDGTLYVAYPGMNAVDALNPDGSLKWRVAVDGMAHFSLGADGTLFVLDEYDIYAFDAAGTPKWHFSSIHPYYGTPAVGTDGSFYLMQSNSLMGFTPAGGVKWQRYLSATDFLISHPAIGPDGTIVVTSSDGNVYAVWPDGAPRWTVDTGSECTGSPSIDAKGNVYLGCADGSLVYIQAGGTLGWRFMTGAPVRWSSPAIGADGTVYIGSEDYSIYAIGP